MGLDSFGPLLKIFFVTFTALAIAYLKIERENEEQKLRFLQFDRLL